MNDQKLIADLKASLAKMVEWARRPSPVPYIPLRRDIDEAERLIAQGCICPSYASNHGHCPIHDAYGRVRENDVNRRRGIPFTREGE